MRRRALFIILVLLSLSACASEQENARETTGTEFYAVATRAEADAETKLIRLGSSLYALRVSRDFAPLRISNENWADDMVASYHSDKHSVDFAIYQFSKEGYPDTLEGFVREEAEEYEAFEIVTDATVNGIPVCYYRSMISYGGLYREDITYAMESGDEYLEIYFVYINYQAEEEMNEIINTLTTVESDVLPLKAHTLRIPRDFTLLSSPDALPVVYESGSGSLQVCINRIPAFGASLTDFARLEARRKGGSDIQTDAEINGVPAAFYRAVEAINGAFHSTLTCLFYDGDAFATLTFCLDGITAEDEAMKLLKTLSVT